MDAQKSKLTKDLKNKNNTAEKSDEGKNSRTDVEEIKNVTIKTEVDSENEADSNFYENFKIELGRLPQCYSLKHLRHFLTKNLNFDIQDVKAGPPGSKIAFVTFKDEETRDKSLTLLNGYEWEGRMLTAEKSSPCEEPFLVKTKYLIMPLTKYNSLSLEERVQMAITPYHVKKYEEQIREKEKVITKILRKFGDEMVATNSELKLFAHWQKIWRPSKQVCELDEMVKSPVLEGYCNNCVFAIGKNSESKKPIVGFRVAHYKEGTIEFGSINALMHLNENIKLVVKVMERFLEGSKYEPFDPNIYTGVWRQCTIKTTRAEDIMLIVTIHAEGLLENEIGGIKKDVRFFFSEGDGLEAGVTSIYFQQCGTWNKELKPHEYEHVYGNTYIEETLLGKKFKIGPDTPTEMNTSACEVLYKKISEILEIPSNSVIIDICYGTGVIGLSIAEPSTKVLGMDPSPKNAFIACMNSVANNMNFASHQMGTPENLLEDMLQESEGMNIVAIVNQPKGGLSMEVIDKLRRYKHVSKLVFITPDPDPYQEFEYMDNFLSLTRTNKNPEENFFVPIRATPVDLFPGLPHFKLAVVFEKYDEYKWSKIMSGNPRPEDRAYFERIPKFKYEEGSAMYTCQKGNQSRNQNEGRMNRQDRSNQFGNQRGENNMMLDSYRWNRGGGGVGGPNNFGRGNFGGRGESFAGGRSGNFGRGDGRRNGGDFNRRGEGRREGRSYQSNTDFFRDDDDDLDAEFLAEIYNPSRAMKFPWWTPECTRVVLEKKRATRRYFRSKKPVHQAELKTARALVRRTFREAQKVYGEQENMTRKNLTDSGEKEATAMTASADPHAKSAKGSAIQTTLSCTFQDVDSDWSQDEMERAPPKRFHDQLASTSAGRKPSAATTYFSGKDRGHSGPFRDAKSAITSAGIPCSSGREELQPTNRRTGSTFQNQSNSKQSEPFCQSGGWISSLAGLSGIAKRLAQTSPDQNAGSYAKKTMPPKWNQKPESNWTSKKFDSPPTRFGANPRNNNEQHRKSYNLTEPVTYPRSVTHPKSVVNSPQERNVYDKPSNWNQSTGGGHWGPIEVTPERRSPKQSNIPSIQFRADRPPPPRKWGQSYNEKPATYRAPPQNARISNVTSITSVTSITQHHQSYNDQHHSYSPAPHHSYTPEEQQSYSAGTQHQTYNATAHQAYAPPQHQTYSTSHQDTYSPTTQHQGCNTGTEHHDYTRSAQGQDYANGSSSHDYATGNSPQSYSTGASAPGYTAGTSAQGYMTGTSAQNYAAGTSAQNYAAGTSAQGYTSGTSAQGYTTGTSAQGYATDTSAQGYTAGTSSQGYTIGNSAQDYTTGTPTDTSAQGYATGTPEQGYSTTAHHSYNTDNQGYVAGTHDYSTSTQHSSYPVQEYSPQATSYSTPQHDYSTPPQSYSYPATTNPPSSVQPESTPQYNYQSTWAAQAVYNWNQNQYQQSYEEPPTKKWKTGTASSSGHSYPGY